MSHASARSCRRGRRTLLAVVLAGVGVLSPTSRLMAQAVNIPLTVSRVARERIEVAIPTGQAPAVGARLIVEREGRLLAELVVEATGLLYMTCRVEREIEPIAVGDRARLLPAAPAPVETPAPAETPASAEMPVAPPPGEVAPPLPATEAAGAPEAAGIHVRQVMGSSVFLDAGRGAGLAEGQRLEVQHEGAKVAVIEVEFLSQRSASCKLVEEGAAITAGDRAIPGPLPPGARPASEPQAAPRVATAGSPAAAGGASRAAGRNASGRAAKAPRWADASGSVALRYQGFRDDSEGGRNTDQLSAVLNLNLTHLGGTALEMRARLRAGQDHITRPGAAAENRPNDRFYELSVGYAPRDGAYSYHLGRLSAGPEVGFDYLDGVLGEVRFGRRWGVGGFYGNRVDVTELSYDSGGSAYGVFLHHLDESPERPLYAETYVSAISEYRGGVVNREYVSVYGRQGSGGKWSLFERAELDLNRDWRAQTGAASTELSNLLLTGTYTLTKAVRCGVTYDERRQVRTLDDRNTPEELFDDALREGLRVSLYLGSGRSVRANLSAGVRRRAGSPEKNETYNASVYYGDLFGWNLLVGSDYAAFSGDTSKGNRVGLRLQKYFGNGHDLELTVGRSSTNLLTLGERRQSQWVRLAGTVQLGHRLFVLGEAELTTGDDLAGKRFFFQLGYRL